MNKKIMLVAFVAFALILNTVSLGAYAFDHGKKGKYHFRIEDKLYRKAGLILKNKEELGLSDEQVKEIKALKTGSRTWQPMSPREPVPKSHHPRQRKGR